MNEVVNVFIDGYGDYSIAKDSTLLELSHEVYGNSYKKYLGARINNEIYHLDKYVEEDMKIEFLDIKDEDGDRIYTKTISAVFIVACKELYDDIDISIENFLGPGLYVEFKNNRNISFTKIREIEKKMHEIIKEDNKIVRKVFPKEKALEIFKEAGSEDIIRLFNSIDKEKVSVYKIDNYIDSFHGYLAPSTGFVKDFKLKYYYPGVIILFPRKNNNYNMDDFTEQKKLAKVYKESDEWLGILDLANVRSLNEKISSGKISEVIKVSEALHEKKIGNIADKICSDKDINIILIAGPSSSGKTTFAQRLAVQLRVNGKRPISISVDDYFVNREDTPLNKQGKPDYESIDAIDLDTFNIDLLRLLEGNDVELPKFNFKSGKREMSGKVVRVDQDHPIIIEGIHGLNPKLTKMIPEKNKFKVYISALTQLSIDSHNRISTSDTRLIRRIVRDNKFRGNNPLGTFDMWKSVRNGEENYIFPFQEEADIMFNSSLVYELCVLKKYIQPLLESIDNSSVHYSNAKRLLRFLEYFRDIEVEEAIPPNSILREFIGGTYLNVH
ncbi:MAG: nucleoside kinase [Tissierellia bacterium]|nr:nucleoside kinase [Tissierellia bacterium]MDD4726081.1 nucleoside kinase [Tissierellia bacterium]